MKIAAILFFCLFPLTALTAQDIDENALFGSPAENIVGSEKVMNDAIASNSQNQGLTISGRVKSDNGYTLSRKFITNWSTNADSNLFNSSLSGNLLVDIRLRQGIKAFANVELGYYPLGQLVPHYYTEYDTNGFPLSNRILVDTNYTTLVLKEFFVDANIARAVYIRAGKQVLQWGKAYFWNPSDLINIQRKSFLDMTAFREGSSGVKVTVPFGTVFNIYGYWDITKITDVADSGVAGKAEFLLGGTEISLSAWAKKGFYPVYALDFSSRIWTIDIRGEASFSYGDNAKKIVSSYETNIPFVTNFTVYTVGQEHNIWVPRVSFGFTKSFDFLEVKDRISFTGEIFWNGGGYYDPEILNDTMRQAVLLNPLTGLYQPNWLSAYYFAVFASVAQFLITDLTFSFNAIVNAVDWSSALSAGLTWTPVYDFSVGFTLTGYAGDTNREYTVGGSALSAGLTATLSF